MKKIQIRNVHNVFQIKISSTSTVVVQYCI